MVYGDIYFTADFRQFTYFLASRGGRRQGNQVNDEVVTRPLHCKRVHAQMTTYTVPGLRHNINTTWKKMVKTFLRIYGKLMITWDGNRVLWMKGICLMHVV